MREFNYARNDLNNFGTGLNITTIETSKNVFKSVPQDKPGGGTDTTPFLSTTDGTNPFLAERVTSIGGIA